MIANPPGSRTPTTGSRGCQEARRVGANASGPGIERLGLSDRAGKARSRVCLRFSGQRRAKKAWRGVLVARRMNQGSRERLLAFCAVNSHHVLHPLHLAPSSAAADALRPCRQGILSLRGTFAGVRGAARGTLSALAVAPFSGAWAAPGAGPAIDTTLLVGCSPGKGVHAA